MQKLKPLECTCLGTAPICYLSLEVVGLIISISISPFWNLILLHNTHAQID